MGNVDDPFRDFNSSPEIIRLVVMMYVRFPLSLRNVEHLLFQRGIMKITEVNTQEPTIKRKYDKPVLIHLLGHGDTEGKIQYAPSEFNRTLSSMTGDPS